MRRTVQSMGAVEGASQARSGRAWAVLVSSLACCQHLGIQRKVQTAECNQELFHSKALLIEGISLFATSFGGYNNLP